MAKRSAERQKFLEDVIITATESGGIQYWAEVEKYDGKSVVISEQDGPTEHVRVNAETIAKGINEIQNDPSISLRRDILASILVGNRNNDGGEIDSEAADVIVQVGVLGKIVYG